MGLFKTAAKVAVASSVHGKVQRRQANRWAQDNQAREQAAAAQAAAAAAPPPPPAVHHAPAQPPAPAAPPAEDVMARRIAQLTQLGELRTAGVLTDAEFEAQKAVILAG